MLTSWGAVLVVLALLPKAYCGGNSASIQTLQVPDCALDCLDHVILTVPCQPTDQACICASSALQQGMSACMAAKCTVRETLVALNVTATTCNAPIRDRSQEYVNVNNILGIISALFVVQRFAYKLWAKVELGLDDWVTLLTLLNGIPNTVLNATGIVQNGMGRDVWTLQPSTITSFNYYFFIIEIIYFLEVAMLKLSLLFFYARIFVARSVQRMLWATVAVCIIFGITFALVAVFQCAPVHYFWTMWDGEHHGRCLDINAIAWSNASISIALDVWMLAIPLWQLGILNLDWRKKVGVGLMFCVGTLVTIVSILRLRSLVKFGFNTRNPTWDFLEAGLWSTVEINVGIICVCMPSLRLLLVRLIPQVFRSATHRYYHEHSSYPEQSSSNAKRGSAMPLKDVDAQKIEPVSP